MLYLVSRQVYRYAVASRSEFLSYTLYLYNSYTGWVESEIDLDPPENGHLTQVLWRATTWVGCADASNGDYHIQVCRYARPGNCNLGSYESWLEPMLLDSSPCGNECHPSDCGTTPPPIDGVRADLPY